MKLVEVDCLEVASRLAGIGFSLAAGEVLGLIGPNGSGKSSLLQCLAGLLPHRGEYRCAGSPFATLAASERARRIGFLPQACSSAWALRVEDVVALGRLPWGDDDRAAIEAAMRQTGVENLRSRRIDRLSGGEQARVWLARVLAGQPRVLLADEPIASLDLRHQRGIMETLRQHADLGNAVILAIHDFSLAARHCDRLCLMQQGRIHRLGTPAEVLTESSLSAVFQVPVYVDLDASPPIVLAR